MWQFTNGITIRMGVIWKVFVVIFGLSVTQLNATSSPSQFATASSFVSNVLSSISASALSSSIQDVISSTNGGISMTEIPSTLGKFELNYLRRY